MAEVVKLADIAERMGVSTVTVSKALSDKKGVSEELREKIKKVADEMGYVKPVFLNKKKPDVGYNIGVLVAEKYLSKYESFYWQMYQHVGKAATNKSCFSVLEFISDEAEQEGILPKLAIEKKVDGIIVIGKLNNEYLKRLESGCGVPCVYMDFYYNMKESDAVISNSFYGTYQLTDYLYQNGHRKIAFVGTLRATKSIMDRYLGYCKAILEHQLELRPDYVIADRTEDNSRMVEEDEIILPEDMPTAFVCNSDITAAYLIQKLRSDGYRVPEDISVVGFDNYLYPGVCDAIITTYEVDMAEMAKEAIRTITKKISNTNYKSGVTIVKGQMVLGETSAPLKQ